MEKLNVTLPAIKRALRSKSVSPNVSNNDPKPKSSRDRVRKYREKLKSDPKYEAKLQELKEKKKAENKAYKDKIRALRKCNPELDKKYKQMQNKWNKTRAEGKKAKVEKTTQSEKKRKSYSTEKKAKALIRKRAQLVRKSLPSESGQWAETMSHIIHNATPRRKSMLLQKPEDDVANTLSINRKGRPLKENAEARRKLAFSSSGKKLWKSAKSLGEYKRRKNKQHKCLTKAEQFRRNWNLKIERFLEQNSRTMPNKKDTVKIDGKHVAKRHLLCSKKELFKKFKTAHPEFNKKYTTFNSMIPKNYKCLNLTCRRVCVCTKDYNIQQKIEALNRESVKQSMTDLKTNPKRLSDLTICPYEQIPNSECVDRKCRDCGTEAISVMFKPLTEASNPSEQVKFHQWEISKESYVGKDGNKKISSRWVQVEKKSNVPDLVENVAETMEKFTGHLFRASYQQMMENMLIEELPMDQAMVVMDFSENIALVPQDEIESAHWTTKQVTLHPLYIVRHASTSTPEIPNILKESLVVLSDYLGHTASSVYAFTVQLISHLQQNPGPRPIRVIHRFTDNCAAQYKCKEAFQHISLIENVFRVKMVYHYTESGHGKGPSDGIGAGIKKKLEYLILGGKVINNAYKAYLALAQNPNEKVNQRIIYVPYKKILKLMPRKGNCIKALKGTQSFHMIIKSNPKSDVIEGHDLSCTCTVCITEQEGPCFYGQYRNRPQKFHLSTGKHMTKNEMQSEPIQSSNNDTNPSQPYQHVHEASIASHIDHVQRVSKYMSRFESQIAERGYKLRGNVPSDGNCFFWAIIDQLDMIDSANFSHVELRRKTVEHMEQLPQSQKTNLEQFLTTNFNQYLKNMAKNGTYADHVCIQNMCKVLEVGIRIIHGDAPDIILGSIESQILVIGYLPEIEHYVSLEHMARLQPEDFVAVKLKSIKSTHIYVAKVIKIEEDDVQLKFMRATAVTGEYIWPPNEDISWQSHDDILQKLQMPTLVPGRGLKLKFNMTDFLAKKTVLK